jgi:hypothetical protein
VVFSADAIGKPCAGDDAAEVRLIEASKAAEADLVFDHEKILADYSASISR